MKILCNNCGKKVSTEVPPGTVIRAYVECPECIEKEDHKKRKYENELNLLRLSNGPRP